MSSLHFKEAEKNEKTKLTSVQVKQGSLTITLLFADKKWKRNNFPDISGK